MTTETKPEIVVELAPGQLWWDKDRVWCDGSDRLDVVFLLLSCDREDDGQMFWKVAWFMWAGGYCGAPVKQYTEAEIRMLQYVGGIESIKAFP